VIILLSSHTKGPFGTAPAPNSKRGSRGAVPNGYFFKLILVWSRKIRSRFCEERWDLKNLLHPPLKQLLNQPNMDLPLKFDRNYPQLPLDKNITSPSCNPPRRSSLSRDPFLSLKGAATRVSRSFAVLQRELFCSSAVPRYVRLLTMCLSALLYGSRRSAPICSSQPLCFGSIPFRGILACSTPWLRRGTGVIGASTWPGDESSTWSVLGGAVKCPTGTATTARRMRHSNRHRDSDRHRDGSRGREVPNGYSRHRSPYAPLMAAGAVCVCRDGGSKQDSTIRMFQSCGQEMRCGAGEDLMP
jgi:hypothetical protein